jgi:outer membrane protein assembly factor BamB
MRRALLLLLVLLACTATTLAANWSNWRGPEQNGVSRERDLPEKFTLKGDNLVWRAPYGSISTPIVQDGQVYLINKVGDGVTMQERVMAFDAKTGKKAWEHHFNVFHTDIVDDRVCWTHMAGDPETGNVYAHGTQGFLTCFSKKGDVLWQRSLTEEFGRVSGYGGRLPSPTVDGDLVLLNIVNASWGEQTVGGTRMFAFDKRTGQVVWWASTGYRVKDTHYSCPVVAVIGGQRLVIAGGGDGGVHAFKVRTGEKVWSYIFGDGAVNCTPVVEGDRVWIGHGEENENGTQGRVICLDGATVLDGKPKLLWKVDGIKVKYASPLLHAGLLYVCDEVGNLYCLEAKSGKQLWDFAYGANTKGSPVWADGKIYIAEVDSKFHVLEADAKGCNRLSQVRFRSTGGAPVELHSSAAVVDGKVYFTTTEELICIGKKDHKAKPGPVPAPPAEAPLPKGAKPAHLQVVPADVSLHPGDSVELKARAFDDHGRLIGEVAADWSLAAAAPPVFPIGMEAPKGPPKKGPPKPLAGELSAAKGATTKLTAAKAPAGQFGRVLAKFGGLTASVRVRVAPVLPYVLDLEDVPLGGIPGGWVNTQGKFSVIRLPDGTLVLSKRNDAPSPLVARANAYIGMPDLTGYTIESDVFGTKVRTDLPDMGIGANRYQFLMAGNDQELRLVSWDAQKRINKVLKFPWKPDVWYRMKLTVTVNGNKALVQGKVWPRGQAEPKNWTIEVEDPRPIKTGSPCLYGFSSGIIGAKSPGTNIYYANVKVTPNK